MRIGVIISCAAAVMLAGCVTDQYNYSPPPPTNEQILQLSDDQLCDVSQRYIDSRIQAEESKRKLNCDPAFQYCKKNGVSKDAMAKCVANRHSWISKMVDPSYAFCDNSGFKDGTDAMATCVASEKRRRVQELHESIQQQAQIDQQNRQFQQQQQLDQENRQFQQQQQHRSVYTSCTGSGNTVNCTSN